MWSESEEWVYEWNPRDQMTRAVKYAGGSANNAMGKNIFSKYFESDDGLNLLRVDELYDSDSDGLDQDDIDAAAWRALWVGTYRPGSLGALLRKSVYVYSDLEDNTPDSADEYTYTYDPVGNVACVYDQSGNLAHEFAQDAFGNELPVGTLGGSDWHDAAGDGIVEHQTGEWVDAFTGLYYFWARWYCGEVGRFTGRDPLIQCYLVQAQPYSFGLENPIRYVDVTGQFNVETDGFPYISSCRCSRSERRTLKRQIQKSCDDLRRIVLNTLPRDQGLVANCILERCWNGNITCRKDCSSSTTALISEPI